MQSLVLNGLSISELQVSSMLTCLSKCEQLSTLVLKDMPITTDATGAALARCIHNLYKLENLQVINCGLTPRGLLLLSCEIEQMVQLQNLSLARNVLRKHPSNKQVIDGLIRMISTSKLMTHLDLSGMFLGDFVVKRIVMEAVALSKSLAAFHFDGNKLSDEARRTVYKIFRHPPRKDDQSNLLMDEAGDSATEFSQADQQDLLVTPDQVEEGQPVETEPEH